LDDVKNNNLTNPAHLGSNIITLVKGKISIIFKLSTSHLVIGSLAKIKFESRILELLRFTESSVLNSLPIA
jgi:hypothetical protein